MQASRATKLFLLLALATSPAQAQTDGPDADAIASSLTEILALATLGTVTAQDQAVQVTRSGADYLVRLPLNGFEAPTDAAVNAVAHPLDGGVWDVTSMTFPSAGTVEMAIPNAGTNRVAFSIGEQTVHVQIDPNFVRPSSFTANLGDVRFSSDQGGQHSEQVFGRYVVDGTLSSEPGGRLDFASHGQATDWHLTAHAPNGFDTDSVVRGLSGRFSVDGLDRTKGTRLLAATRALIADARTPAAAQAAAAGEAPGISPEQRQDLQSLIDAVSGLLSRFEADETLDGISFTVGPANGGTIGRMRINMAGDAADDRLNARIDIGVDDLAMTALSAETAAYVPHHVDIKSVLAGVRTGPLMALLRAATEQNADPAALQAQGMALLGDVGARIGIDSLVFDSGPVRVTASARIAPRPNGQLGGQIHVAATGVDALIAQAAGKPALQQVLPVIFAAKGMGRPEGDALVWDIALGDGPITVNGVPFGQQAAHKR
jgi:hypothetical protein